MFSCARGSLLGFVAVIGVIATSEASAQKSVMLQLRPRVGDTISMRLDQRTELVGRRADPKGSTSSMVNTITTFSRAVVESGVATSTTIVAITDSVLMSSNDQNGKGPAPTTQRQLQGQRVRLQVAPDGSIGMPADGTTPAKGMSRTASLIPATFPTKAVAVGEKWVREAPLPAGTSQLGTAIVGWVQATFRLDSLTRGGELAWVSMRGALHPDPASTKMEGVATVDDGNVEGYMVIDRNRGWLTESKFSIVAHSSLRQPFGMTGPPMSFEIRLVQTLRTIK